MQKGLCTNKNNTIVYNHAFKNTFIDLRLFGGFEKETKREIRVRDFGKWNGDGFMSDEFHYDMNIFIVIHGIE